MKLTPALTFALTILSLSGCNTPWVSDVESGMSNWATENAETAPKYIKAIEGTEPRPNKTRICTVEFRAELSRDSLKVAVPAMLGQLPNDLAFEQGDVMNGFGEWDRLDVKIRTSLKSTRMPRDKAGPLAVQVVRKASVRTFEILGSTLTTKMTAYNNALSYP